jgi:hypothetical protein
MFGCYFRHFKLEPSTGPTRRPRNLLWLPLHFTHTNRRELCVQLCPLHPSFCWFFPLTFLPSRFLSFAKNLAGSQYRPNSTFVDLTNDDDDKKEEQTKNWCRTVPGRTSILGWQEGHNESSQTHYSDNAAKPPRRCYRKD